MVNMPSLEVGLEMQKCSRRARTGADCGPELARPADADSLAQSKTLFVEPHNMEWVPDSAIGEVCPAAM